MNSTAEMGAADQKPNTPPPPPPPPPPLPVFKPTAAKGDDHHIHSTINLISDPEREDKMDSESSACSSSFSSSDSESGFFQINPPELAHPPPPPPPPPSTTPANLYTDGVEKTLSPNRENPSGSGAERRSPAVQSMARDPNRIPSSIFARSPVTPVEWSVASNESLFSIHMEHSSFSKDQIILAGRSGELRGFASGTIEYPMPWISPDSRSAAAAGGVVMEIDEAAAASANAEAMREVMKAAVEGKESDKKVMLARSISRHSDGSTTSFAFPILTGDGRIGSIKVNFEHHKDHQLNQQIKPSKILSEKVPTATMRSHRWAHDQGPAASVQSRWFQCFPSRKFRCCCDY